MLQKIGYVVVFPAGGPPLLVEDVAKADVGGGMLTHFFDPDGNMWSMVEEA